MSDGTNVSDEAMAIGDFPGFAHLSPEVRGLLESVDTGDDARRPALLERAAEVIDVFAALGLLQFVFMPENEDAGEERVEIDLLDPDAEPEEAVAWFSVDEAGYDDERDAVLLFGSLTEILNAPIVLDIEEDDEEEEDGVELEGPGENGHAPGGAG